jgi:hypothetical protein
MSLIDLEAVIGVTRRDAMGGSGCTPLPLVADDVLPVKPCLDALAQLRRAKYFQVCGVEEGRGEMGREM